MADTVLIDSRDGIAILTLNRPEKLNALNYALIDRLLAILDAIEIDGSIRAAILTGAGERAFSAGGDIYEFSESVARGADVAVRDFVTRGQRLTARLEAFRKPVIAAVNGLAFGGGCEITEAVPLAIAAQAELSRFVVARLKRGGNCGSFGRTNRTDRQDAAAGSREARLSEKLHRSADSRELFFHSPLRSPILNAAYYGASAGGIEALSSFFDAMPADSGYACCRTASRYATRQRDTKACQPMPASAGAERDDPSRQRLCRCLSHRRAAVSSS